MNPTADRPAVSTAREQNGVPTLSERVRSLRLPDAGADGGRPARLPWALAGVFLLTTVYFALEAATPVDEATLNQAVEERLAETGAVAKKEGAAPGQGFAKPQGADGGEIALESKGYLVAVSQIQVSPLVSGRVVKLTFKEGMTVPKDFVLAQLETTEYQAEYDRIAAQVAGATARWQELWKYREAEVRQVKAELEDAQAQRAQLLAEWKRSGDLRLRDALSQKEYEQAESAYKSMDFRVQRLQLAYDLLQRGPRDERIASAKAEVDQWQAELVRAKWKLDNTTVRAPIAGTILTKRSEEGNFVNPAAFSNSGLPAGMCDMADLAEMEVDLAVSERDIAKVFQDQECKVRAEAFPDRPYQGHVSRVMPIGDRGKAAVPVRVKIAIPRAEAGRFLRPDMGALVTFYSRKAAE